MTKKIFFILTFLLFTNITLFADIEIQGNNELQGNIVAGIFKPTSIPNCEVWLDASDASTISLNGAKVTNWADKSGNGNDASLGIAANQPDYVAGSPGYIDFVAASTEYLNLQLTSKLNIQNSDYTIIIVYQISIADTHFLLSSAVAENFEIHSVFDDTFRFIPKNPFATYTVDSPAPYAGADYHLIHCQVSDDKGQISADGGAFQVNASSGARSAVDEIIVIGLRRFNWSLPLHGRIGVVIVYSRALNATEKVLLEQDLMKIWSI